MPADERVMTNSDEYTATLLALGPGLVGCALMAIVEFRTDEFILMQFIYFYAAVLLAFLPSLPALGLCLGQAHPRIGKPRRIWWIPSMPATVWHIAIVDGSYRMWEGHFVM